MLEALGVEVVAAGGLAPNEIFLLVEVLEANWALAFDGFAVAVFGAFFGDLGWKEWGVRK